MRFSHLDLAIIEIADEDDERHDDNHEDSDKHRNKERPDITQP